MSANEKWLRTGRTVYALNDRGINAFFASVQDAHTEEKELERIAELMRCAPELLEVAQSILVEDMITYLPAEYVAKVRAVIAKATGG